MTERTMTDESGRGDDSRGKSPTTPTRVPVGCNPTTWVPKGSPFVEPALRDEKKYTSTIIDNTHPHTI